MDTNASVETLEARLRATATTPLSEAQATMWLAEQLAETTGLYHIALAVDIKGLVDPQAIESALRAIQRKHSPLGSRFVEHNGTPLMTRAGTRPLVLAQTVLRAANDGEALERADAERPFDLASGPPMRAHLLSYGEQTHTLMLVFHHLAFDGWSAALFLAEFAQRLSGNADDSPLSVDYAQYVAWQNQQRKGADAQEKLAEWTRELSGVQGAQTFPATRSEEARTLSGDTIRFALPKELRERVEQFAQSNRVTAFAPLMAAFQTLLHRFTANNDIVVGTPSANRTRAQIEPIIGHFVNTLPIRTSFADRPSFKTLATRVGQTTNEALRRQDVSFDRIVSQLPRQKGTHPLFRTMFALHNMAEPTIEIPGMSLHVRDVALPVSPMDVTLSVRPLAAGYECVLEYSTERFDNRFARSLADRYHSLLQTALDAPDKPVTDLALVTPEETDALCASAAPLVAPKAARTVHGEFERIADAHGQRIAVTDTNGKRKTYDELRGAARRVAAHLVGAGASPGAHVAILLPRSIDFPVAVLGCMMAGATPVPLDPSQPAERLEQLLKTAAPTQTLTSEAFAERVRALSNVPPIVVSNTDVDPAHLPATSGLAPAYLAFTSGSTGTPKGVVVSHQNILYRMLWEQAALPLTPHDAVLLLSAPGFDAAIWELMRAFLAGARLVVAPAGPPDARVLSDLVVKEGVTVLSGVPSLLDALFSAPGFARGHEFSQIVCSGEALHADVRDRILAAANGPLFNFFGQTEVSIDATYKRCSSGTAGYESIGAPIPGARVYLLDAGLSPVPNGAPGELYIGGPSVAQGYARQPAATADRFVPDPFAGLPGARMYRTGDRARRDKRGDLEFLGRTDGQRKVRGVRVELGEIEALLLDAPAVSEAAVVAIEQAPNTDLLETLLDDIERTPTIEMALGSRETVTPEKDIQSYNEWDPLEEVIVGVADGATVPEWHPALRATMPKRYWPFFQKNGGKRFEGDMVKAANRDLDQLAHILESEGVRVRRPDPVDYAKPFQTPEWQSLGGLYSAMPRDLLLVVGDTIVEAPMPWRSRYFEINSYRTLLKEFFHRGARWISAPKPQLSDALYDDTYEVPADDEPMRYVLTEFEPVFDAADFIRCGRDILYIRSHVTNQFGVDWLKRQFGPGYRFTELPLLDTKPMHIDTTYMPLGPGRMLVNPERVLEKAPVLKDWEFLPAPLPCTPDDVKLYFSGKWLSMNILMIDKERVLVSSHEDRLIKAFKDWGLRPIPVHFQDFYRLGGSIHCATLDVKRRGTLQSYCAGGER